MIDLKEFDSFRMPGEFERHDATVMIWPWRPGSWGTDTTKAREAFRCIIHELSNCEDVYVLANKASIDNANMMLHTASDAQYCPDRIHIIECENDDAWARDTGATFVLGSKNGTVSRIGMDWCFNAWGGTYNGLYASWKNDDLVAKAICDITGDARIRLDDFVLEGGSIHVDGEGTLITTEECLLSPGRNPKLSREEIEDVLKKCLGIEKVIWIPYGIYNDETDGHIDNICAFSRPGEVLLAWTDDKDDPQYERSLRAYEILSGETDAKGRRLSVTKLPIPSKPILIDEEDLSNLDFEDGEDVREVGERLAASYINHYIANDRILVPVFGDDNDGVAINILKECYPERKIVPIDAGIILKGGGNIHCITQQIPSIV